MISVLGVVVMAGGLEHDSEFGIERRVRFCHEEQAKQGRVKLSVFLGVHLGWMSGDREGNGRKSDWSGH